MNKYFFIVLAIGWYGRSFAQKMLVSNDTYKNWTKLGDYNISNDGKFVSYLIRYESGIKLVICRTDGKFIRQYSTSWGGSFLAQFTADSKYAVFKSTGDSLVIVKTSDFTTSYISGVKSFRIINGYKQSLLSWQSGDDLIIKNVGSDKLRRFENVEQHLFNEDGTVLVTRKKDRLEWHDLQVQISKTIFRGVCSDVILHPSGASLSFIVEQKDGYSVWYYHNTMTTARIQVSNKTPGLKKGFVLSHDGPAFSKNGQYIYIRLEYSALLQKDSNMIVDDIDVWKYDDAIIMPAQLLAAPRKYLAVTSVANNPTVVQLEDEDAVIHNFKNNDNYLLLRNNTFDLDAYFLRDQVPQYSVLSLKEGVKELLFKHSGQNVDLKISPKEKFITWEDTISNDIYSYEIETKKVSNLTTSLALPNGWCSRNGGYKPRRFDTEIKGWGKNDLFFLICDGYDMWQIDPKGEKLPINITAGYGRKNEIHFQLGVMKTDALKDGDILLMYAIDKQYNNGFWKSFIGQSKMPQKGSLDPCLYSDIRMLYHPFPLKANNAESYLIVRQTASSSPNLFLTRNFKEFLKLSDIYPERSFNWMQSELIRWKMYDGKLGTGILYKPENFDPHKKYPIIFHYYQQKTGELHLYKQPDLDANGISIPWYVSNGYLVFVPDINAIDYEPGRIGEIVINSVESAARYLYETNFWVDRDRMGLQGHSFGGYETNLIIANSTLFAAAQSSAGVSDLVSEAGSLAFGEQTMYSFVEHGQPNLGTGTLPWTHPEVYIRNSPIFRVDKIKTPLLMSHGRNDGVVKFTQAVEFFTALRRAEKKVWMVTHPDNHIMGSGDPKALDFVIRQQQFFDHYLKGRPAPLWMVEGISAKYKGVRSGLQLDSLNRTP